MDECEIQNLLYDDTKPTPLAMGLILEQLGLLERIQAQ